MKAFRGNLPERPGRFGPRLNIAAKVAAVVIGALAAYVQTPGPAYYLTVAKTQIGAETSGTVASMLEKDPFEAAAWYMARMIEPDGDLLPDNASACAAARLSLKLASSLPPSRAASINNVLQSSTNFEVCNILATSKPDGLRRLALLGEMAGRIARAEQAIVRAVRFRQWTSNASDGPTEYRR